MRVLVQGFGPFGAHSQNPSELVVRSLEGFSTAGVELHTAVLPVTRAAVARDVPELITTVQPDAWIGVGLWAGRSDITVERFAMNVLDFPIPDGDGRQPRDEPIDPGAPLALRTPFPHRAVVDAWREAGLPAAVSNSAGAYLCNMSLFLATRAMTRFRGTETTTGFVHIPQANETDAAGTDPALPLKDLSEAVRIAIREVAIA